MTKWQEIKTFEALESFQVEFRQMEPGEQGEIIVEMLAVIEAYRMNIEVIDHKASTSRDEPPSLRKRRGKARRVAAAEKWQREHQLKLKLTD